MILQVFYRTPVCLLVSGLSSADMSSKCSKASWRDGQVEGDKSLNKSRHRCVIVVEKMMQFLNMKDLGNV